MELQQRLEGILPFSATAKLQDSRVSEGLGRPRRPQLWQGPQGSGQEAIRSAPSNHDDHITILVFVQRGVV